MKFNITQEDVLAFCDEMEEVQDAIIDNPEDDIVHPMNPCHYNGCIFSAFEIGKDFFVEV